jgi:hypothetical protein
MIWVIIIGIILYLLYRFFTSLNEDNYDLQSQSLSEKFHIVANLINQSAFNGRGQIITLDKRSFNLYEDGENQIVNFTYSTGHLTITWKYKYFQKEIVHEKQFNDVRNISVFTQQKIAETMIVEMNTIILQHQNNVLKEAEIVSPLSTKKVTSRYLLELKIMLEDAFRETIVKAVISAEELPEMMHGVMAMNAAAGFSEEMKGTYNELKIELAAKNVDLGLTEQQYRKFIDDIAAEILAEFIELPDQQN